MSRAVLLALVALLFSSCAPVSEPTRVSTTAADARIDLSEWNFERDGVVRLLGNTWELYWCSLYAPDDFSLGRVAQEPVLVWGTTGWHDVLVDGEPLGPDGFATYRTRIMVPEAGAVYGFYIQNQDSAYLLWMDGVLVAENGRVATFPEGYEPQRLPRLFYHCARGTEIELVFQIANYTHKWGGLTNNVYMGLPDQMLSYVDTLYATIQFLSGAILLMSLYQLFLYINRRKSISSLYFSLFCFSVLFWYLFNGDYQFFRLFPWFPLVLGIRLQYAAPISVMPFLLLFIDEAYSGGSRLKARPRAVRVFAYASLALVLVPLLTPVRFFTVYIMPVYYALVAVGIVFMLVLLARACVARHLGSRYSMAGFLAFLGTVVYDIIVDRKLIDGSTYGPFSPAGLFVFMLFQAFALTRIYSHDYEILDDLKNNLEEKVRLRTAELHRTREGLYRKERLVALGTLAGGVAHEILNPLSGITGPLDVVRKEIADSELAGSESLARHLSYIEQNTQSIGAAVKNLDALIKDREIVKSPVGLLPAARKAVAQCSAPDRAMVRAVIDDSVDVELPGDAGMIQQILTIVLDNAMRAIELEGEVRIRYSPEEKAIVIEDDGCGMNEDEIAQAFNPFYTTRASTGGTGLGLYLAQQLASSLGWTISLESTPGEGTRIIIATR
ncbi:MAG: ATP-binding protein [Spirochaetales bacterium]|nr:ATP-binding protein [Spirochaetales bacterium]